MNEVEGARVLVARLAVSAEARALLRAAGFRTVRELLRIPPVRLARELGADPRKVLQVLDEVRVAARMAASDTPSPGQAADPLAPAAAPEAAAGPHAAAETSVPATDPSGATQPTVPQRRAGATALTMLEARERTNLHIVTYSRQLDSLFDGGVPLGEVTEICGVPGAGKTQLCMQLAVDVTIPAAFGGIDGDCLYIDTEGSFAVDRVLDITEAVLCHLDRVAHAKGPAELRAAQTAALNTLASPESLLKRIHYCRVHNYAELVAIVMTLDDVVSTYPRVKLVVVDSVAFHFRQDFTDMRERARLLSNVAQGLNTAAAKLGLAVVATNQMTTKVQQHARGLGATRSTSANGFNIGKSTESYLAPALGESWSHAVTSRVIVERSDRTVVPKEKRRRTTPTGAGSEGRQLTKSRRCNRTDGTSDNLVGDAEDRGAASVPPEATARVQVRTASLVKSPYRRPGTAEFAITASGVRDCL